MLSGLVVILAFYVLLSKRVVSRYQSDKVINTHVTVGRQETIIAVRAIVTVPTAYIDDNARTTAKTSLAHAIKNSVSFFAKLRIQILERSVATKLFQSVCQFIRGQVTILCNKAETCNNELHSDLFHNYTSNTYAKNFHNQLTI